MSSESLLTSSGIFRDERVIRFLLYMTKYSDRCLQTLYELTGNDLEAFNRGLKMICEWNLDAPTEEVNKMIDEYNDSGLLYHYVLRVYIQELYKRGKKQNITISAPSFPEFLHIYYKKLTESNAVKTMKYFGASSLERNYEHSQALRLALAEATKNVLYTGVPSSKYAIGGDEQIEAFYRPTTYTPKLTRSLLDEHTQYYMKRRPVLPTQTPTQTQTQTQSSISETDEEHAERLERQRERHERRRLKGILKNKYSASSSSSDGGGADRINSDGAKTIHIDNNSNNDDDDNKAERRQKHHHRHRRRLTTLNEEDENDDDVDDSEIRGL